ncbi:MAG: N-6 DNA methylase [Planctomycetes bacterium]|nr:N-6 DNA methylase [Planctomycetota bacterium]
MSRISTIDRDLAPGDVAELTSADAVAAFFSTLGYRTDPRRQLSPESLGLAGDAAAAVREIELLAEDAEGFLRVVFVRLRSLTAKGRNDLARMLGRTNVDHLLVLTADFRTLEFVLLDKRRREQRGPAARERIQVVPLVIAFDRKGVGSRELRIIRRFTWTGRDGLEQFDKLRSVFAAAAFSEDYFSNRALFADHYLLTRLRDDAAWRENPANAFHGVRELLRDPREDLLGQGEHVARDRLYEPLFKLLGFRAQRNKKANSDQTVPDYLLCDANGKTLTAAFTYAWDRWLDGPDHQQDEDTPDENPGACVVTALEDGVADWIIVTNGRQWRLYSRRAHSRATNFYEVDLPETLLASGDTDPNEAFRYWWLFFRAQAFHRQEAQGLQPVGVCWLDRIAEGSSEYAKELGERLKDRVFKTVFPHLARGFLEDRRQRLGESSPPTEEDLRDTFEATLTLLYRLLFLLFAESRDLLPVREAPYHDASLKRIKQEIAAAAGIADSEAEARLEKAHSAGQCTLYDRLARLFAVMDKGDPSLNVPTYNGGLFITDPEELQAPDSALERELRIARYLARHKVPDRFLARAIDLLARDEDEKTFQLVFIDYKSLSVRHLGSIYEGLLEFKLKIAEEDLTTRTEKKREKYLPLASAQSSRKRQRPEIVVSKGHVYLSNDKAERKASGSYYTPDPIVEYIVEHTIGPVLKEKLAGVLPQFRNVRKTFDRECDKAEKFPVQRPEGGTWDPREFALEKVYATHKDLVDELFEFRALDPAMGSGHFLVEAVDFITDRLLTFLNQFPVNPVSVMLEKTRRSILEALGEQGVSVDPAKLTDVNLLKRHVLKRCIYGVDLNPMAVELAKVSLWLDAFTIGAPLSFLDHHLRCGNSLIGATFADLKAATKTRLFGVDYEPLLRAIRHVLFVNRMADATAAEVRQSASQYDQARRELSGYQIVLDLLVARHFGHPTAPDLLGKHGDIDLSTRERFVSSFEALWDRQLIAEVEQLARRPDLRFFHWEIEFPEVFFEFADADQRQLKHRNEIAEGSAGFDAVVGNPPYDELSEHAAGRELPEKAYFKQLALYRDALGGRLNVFRLFIVRALSVLRKGGRHSFIVPMALLADQFTAPLRRRLLTDGLLRSIVAFPQKDDPHNRVFLEAKLSTCIFVAEKRIEQGQPMQIATYPGKSFDDVPRRCSISFREVELLEPEGFSLPTVSQADVDRWRAIAAYGRTARFGHVAPCYLGEVMFNASTHDLISTEPIGPRIMRGGNVNRYVCTDDAKQGEIVFLDHQAFVNRYARDARLNHRKAPRVAFQEAAPIDNWRRLIPAYMPAGRICGHTLRYFTSDARYDLFAILACFASSLCEWRFGLTSTNNHVNAYEVDALPIPRFERLTRPNPQLGNVEHEPWQALLSNSECGPAEWEGAVVVEIQRTPAAADAWPDTIHDALAAAGHEMTRLAEGRQRLTNDFSAWLVEALDINPERFSGMSYLRGGQADFDRRGWPWLAELLKRNRRACSVDPERLAPTLKQRYEAVSAELQQKHSAFTALDAAIDHVVWQLVGLNPDGSLPS